MLQVETEDLTHVFAVEYLPGQFDQRADSAAQCIQLISQGEKPTVRSARIYVLFGKITDEELARGLEEYRREGAANVLKKNEEIGSKYRS